MPYQIWLRFVVLKVTCHSSIPQSIFHEVYHFGGWVLALIFDIVHKEFGPTGPLKPEAKTKARRPLGSSPNGRLVGPVIIEANSGKFRGQADSASVLPGKFRGQANSGDRQIAHRSSLNSGKFRGQADSASALPR
jgi:hypothetical protein